MIDAIRSEDPIRSKIEALGTTLSLPTVRKALGILEGAHASDKPVPVLAVQWWCSGNAHPPHEPGFCSMSDRR